MKKIISYVLMSVFAVAAVTLTSCKKDETTGEAKLLNLYITPYQSIVELNDTVSIKVLASYSTGDTVDVTSLSTISVDNGCVEYKDGKLVGKSEGTAILTASFEGKQDLAVAVASEIESFQMISDGDANTILMCPEDVLDLKKALVVKAIFKAKDRSDKNYEKVLKYGDYELSTSSANLELKDTTLKALETGKGELDVAYHGKSGAASVFVGKLLETSLKLDGAESSGATTDVVVLGVSADIKAEAKFKWEGVKSKVETDKDSTATVDILSKIKVLTSTPSIISLSEDGTSLSPVQSGEGEIHSEYLTDTLERTILVKGDTSSCKYRVQVNDEWIYAGGTISYVFIANYADGRSLNLTNTQNDSIVCVPVTKKGKDTTATAKEIISAGTYQLADGCPTENMVYGKDQTFHFAVTYKKGAESVTTLSEAIDGFYGNPRLIVVTKNEGKFVALTTGDTVTTDTLYHRKDFSLVDSYNKDYTDSVKIKELTGEDGVKTIYRCIPVKSVAGSTLTLTYGPGKRSHTLFIDAMPNNVK